MDRISVIIPIFNAEATISRCLNSILQQSYHNIEIICVNDGSTDRTLEILQKYEAKDCRVRVLDKQNEGASKARNIGIDAASGNFILFVDADDYISSDMILNLYQAIAQGYDISVAGYTEILSYNKHFYFDYSNCKDKNSFILKCIQNTGGLVCSKLYRADLIKDNSLYFNEKLILSEDMIFALQAFLLATKIVAIENYNYYYVRKEETYNSLDVISRIHLNFIAHDILIATLKNYIINGKETVFKNRLQKIIFSHLLLAAKANDYCAFLRMKDDILPRIEDLSFKFYRLIDKIWLSSYKHKFFRLSYIICCSRIQLNSIARSLLKRGN